MTYIIIRTIMFYRPRPSTLWQSKEDTFTLTKATNFAKTLQILSLLFYLREASSSFNKR